MMSLNIPVVLSILFLLSPHFGLTKIHSGHPHNSIQKTRTVNPEDFEISPPSDPQIENSFPQLSPMNNNCGILENCFGQEEVNVKFKDGIEEMTGLDQQDNYEEEQEKESVKSWRIKRYPEHLDPNQLPFYPFWIRVGECPLSSDGARQHYCPTPTANGKWVCIDDYQLCDGMKNCPNAEDESGHYCLFYKALKNEVELLTRTMSSMGSTSSNPLEEARQNSEMMRPKSSRLSWTVA